MPPAPAPFDGLRVLDLTSEIAGAYASKLLVDAGADVTLVEATGGDPLRSWTQATAPLHPGEDGVLFRFLRASTRSLRPEAAEPGECAHEALAALAARADIVLQDYVPGHGSRLDPEWLLNEHRSLVVVSISPWGTTGPWADRPATEFTVQAASGGTARRGLPDRPPVSAGGRLVEWLTGAFAAVGAATAWRHARRTGVGQHVDVSMLETAILCLLPYNVIAAQWLPGVEMPRSIEVPSIEPAADGPVGFCTQTAQQWMDFCALIGRPDLADDRSLLHADNRCARLDEVAPAIAAFTTAHTVNDLVELATALRVPATPVGNGAVVRGFEQFTARDSFVAGGDGLQWPRPAYRLSAAPLRTFGPSPLPGAEPLDDALARWPPRPPATPEQPDARRPLEGMRVVDLSAFWAGPFATAFLAAMGADVVKVESPRRPDGMRFLGGIKGEAWWERSMVFAGANPGKRDVTLDIADEAGRDLLWRLIDRADVVIENFTPRVLDQLGVTWDELHRRRRECVLVRMPAFGLEGPWRDRPGFAMTIEQTSGLAWVTGYEDRPLVPRGPCDPLGGMHAVLAILGAFEHRRRTGEGQLVEVPLIEGALSIAAEAVLEFQRCGEVLGRQGNRGPFAVPQGLYPAAGDDRWIALACATDPQWFALCRVIGAEALAADPTLASAPGRRDAHDVIDESIASWTEGRPAALAATELVDAGVPAAEVVPAHLIHHNEQLAHREFLQRLDHPVTGAAGYPGFPMRFSAFGPALFASPPPTFGQHTVEVLHGLGVTEPEIAALEERGVVSERPIGV